MRFASRDELLARLCRGRSADTARLHRGTEPARAAVAFAPCCHRAYPTEDRSQAIASVAVAPVLSGSVTGYAARGVPNPDRIDDVVTTASGAILDRFQARPGDTRYEIGRHAGFFWKPAGRALAGLPGPRRTLALPGGYHRPYPYNRR